MRMSRPVSFLLVALAANACAPATPSPPAPSAAASAAPEPVVEGSRSPVAGGTSAPGSQDYPVDPLGDIRGQVLTVDSLVVLPTLAGNPPTSLAWQVDAGDRDKVALADNRLTPLKPGALRLTVTANGRTLRVLHAVKAAAGDGQAALDTPFIGGSRADFPTPEVIQDDARWKAVWEDSYLPPQDVLDKIKAVPTGPPPAPPRPQVDFGRRSVLAVNLAVTSHQQLSEPVVTHIEGPVVHVVAPDRWDPGLVPPSPTPVPSGAPPVPPPMPKSATPYFFDVPKLPAQVEVKVEGFE